MTKPTTPHKEPETSKEAKRMAIAILDVMAGSRTPQQAAEALGVSLPRYYQLETRALTGLLLACETQPRGRRSSAETELASARKEADRLRRELTRYQSLVRLTQRTAGVPAPTPTKVGKRKRKPVVRAMRRAEELRVRAGSEPPGEGGQG
ncbi:MAG: hypothetical protein C0467_32775 [Planctomycetaceae bacterium]|nr:hypothetical protein [Planctomycetaceae bacterium]